MLEKKKFKIIPAKTKLISTVFLNSCNNIRIANKENITPKNELKNLGKGIFNNVPNTTPKPAEEEIPNVYPSHKGFKNMLCNTHPTTAKLAPTTKAAIVLGNLI